MNKTEAAKVIATNIAAQCTKYDLDDSEVTALMIAEAISRMTHETVEGSYAHTAATVRPADRTIRIAYRRNAGII